MRQNGLLAFITYTVNYISCKKTLNRYGVKLLEVKKGITFVTTRNDNPIF